MSEQDDLEAYNAELAAREEAEHNRSVEAQINEAYDRDMALAELSTLRSRLAEAERERDGAVIAARRWAATEEQQRAARVQAEAALSRARELVRMYVAWRMSGQHRGALDEMLAMDRAFAEFLTAAPVDATDPANTPKEPT